MDKWRNLLVKMSEIDRRYIFVTMAVVVILPFFSPIQFKVKPSEETLRFDRALDVAIASRKPIMVGVDYGPQTMAELEPILLAVMHKLFHKGKKVVFLTFNPETTALMHRYLPEMEKQYGLVYGEDYVFLGVAAAYHTAIYALGSSIEEYFHEDDRGTPIGDIPLMKDVKKYADVSAVFSIASNNIPHHWVTWGVAPYGFDFLMASTATQAPEYFPFIQTGQVKGIIAGGRAGAEYEWMMVSQGVLSEPGGSTRGLGSQSLALLAIVIFIILGNIGYFASRLQGGRESK
ncbi:MAG: hypothetical protein GY854_04315 [Deltaproteobacteria bacterium]|nr:hypothetical protein [Deltaproteobacteria bacterium]